MKNNVKIILSSILTAVLLCSLCACGNTKSPTATAIKSALSDVIPNARLISSAKSGTGRNYKFTNGEFDFEYNEYLISSPTTIETDYQSNYIERLFAFKESEINDMIGNYGFVKLDDFYYYDDDGNGAMIISHIDNICHIEVVVCDYIQFEQFFEFFNSLNDKLNDYYPMIESELLDARYSVKIYHRSGLYDREGAVHEFEMPMIGGQMDCTEHATYSSYEYLHMVFENIIIDDYAPLAQYEKATINQVSINGQNINIQCDSDMFIYDPITKTYYALVSCGEGHTEIQTSEFTHHKFITSCYSNVTYAIDNLDLINSYKIGKNQYKMYWSNEGQLIVTENGVDLGIQTMDKIRNYEANKNHVFITVDDFAKISGLEFVEMNYMTDTMVFNTK